MALLWIESFDSWIGTYLHTYNTRITIGNGGWGQSLAGGRRGTACWSAPIASASYWSKLHLQAEHAGLVVGFAVKPDLSSSSSDRFIWVLSDTNAGQFSINITQAGRVQIMTAPGGSVLAESSDGAISSGSWQYFEVKFTCDGSDTVEVRVDGSAVVGPTSGLNLQQSSSGGAGRLVLYCPNLSEDCVIDDMVIMDLTGAKHNDFLGDCKVDAFLPDADGYHTDFTPSTGSDHHDVIDDTGAAGTSQYIEEDTVTERDSFGMTPTGDLPTVYAIAIRSVGNNPDAGQAEATPFLRMDGVDYDQTPFTRGNTIESSDEIVTDRPDTGGAWSKTVLQSTEFGWEFSNAN